MVIWIIYRDCVGVFLGDKNTNWEFGCLDQIKDLKKLKENKR